MPILNLLSRIIFWQTVFWHKKIKRRNKKNLLKKRMHGPETIVTQGQTMGAN